MSERLQKYLARAGIGSRRACEVLIKEGKVSLNGNLAKIGATVSNQDIVEFEGKVIQVKETDLKVIILNKPEGVLSSNAREKKIPFFGICFGMQMAIIEFARNKLKIKKATSSEFGVGGVPIIGLISEWNKDGKLIKGTDKDLGGTMRLGLYEAKLKEKSFIKKIYKSKLIQERHRHRYEVNIAIKINLKKMA